MAVHAIGQTRPPIICAGIAQTRHLHVYTDAATSTGSHDGTYTLEDPGGAPISGVTGVVVTNSVTASFTPSTSLAPGSGYTEVWSLTVGGVARVWRIAAIVQSWSIGDDEVLVAPAHVLARYPGMTEYPSGTTSWLSICTDASDEVLADYARLVPLRGSQSTDRQLLMLAALDKACERIALAQARGGNAAALAMADRHGAAYADRMQSMLVGLDTSGDGAPDSVTRAQDAPGFPPPAPLG